MNCQRRFAPTSFTSSESSFSSLESATTLHYLLFHKPFNVLCQFTKEGMERKTLADFIPVPDVYPAGRLDHDSEGLVLLTDDGVLQHRLTNPKFGHRRTYLVQVEGEVTEAALERLRTGIKVQDYTTRPAQAQRIQEPGLEARCPPIRFRQQIPTSWIELTLVEGRNRQVRRMTAAVGFPTLRLIRVAIGPLRIDGLGVGEWRPLSPREVKLSFCVTDRMC